MRTRNEKECIIKRKTVQKTETPKTGLRKNFDSSQGRFLGYVHKNNQFEERSFAKKRGDNILND